MANVLRHWILAIAIWSGSLPSTAFPCPTAAEIVQDLFSPGESPRLATRLLQANPADHLGQKVSFLRKDGRVSNGTIIGASEGSFKVAFVDTDGIAKSKVVDQVFDPHSLSVDHLQAGMAVSVARKSGGISNGLIQELHEDGTATVSLEMGAAQKTVPVKQLMDPLQRLPTPRIALGEDVAVVRSDGSYTSATILTTQPLTVYFEEGGKPFKRPVTLDELHPKLSIPSGHIKRGGEYSFGTSGSEVNGKVVELDRATGWATLELENGSRRTVRVQSLREPLHIDRPDRPLHSVKQADYIARSGSIVEVSLQSPELQRAVNDAISIIAEETGIRPGSELLQHESVRQAVYEAWIKKVVPMFEDQNFENYGELRSRMIQAGGGRADLGKLLQAKSAVCRELSIAAHVTFAEFGIPTRIVTGNIHGGSHAWVKDAWGKIIDNNYTRSVETVESYYQKAPFVTVKESTLVRPMKPISFGGRSRSTPRIPLAQTPNAAFSSHSIH